MRGSKATSVPSSASRVSAPTTSALRTRRSASATARPPTAVMSCVPLMRARPSFGSRTSGAAPGRAAPRRRAGGAPRTRTRPRRRGRARGGRGARGRRSRPTEPCEGTTGWTRRFSISTSSSSVSRRTPEKPLARTFARRSMSARVSASSSGVAHARGVRADEVELQLAQAVEGDVDVGEVAEAGGHAVDDRAARDRVVHDAPRGPDRRRGPRRRARRRSPARATDSSPGRGRATRPSIARGAAGR